MDFGFTPEQEALRETARRFLEAEYPVAYARRMMEDPVGFDEGLWHALAGLGWTGLVFPEAVGGAGLGMVDLVVVLEEMGRVVLPGPFLSTVVLGGLALALGGSAAQQARYLAPLARGELKATLAHVGPDGRWDADGIGLRATRADGGFRLAGCNLFVPDAHVADLLVVAGRTGGRGPRGVTLFLVERSQPGVGVRPLRTMDQTRRLFEVTFDDVAVPRAAVLGRPGGGWPLLERVLDRARVALCAEMCGGAERVLEMSVAYARVREQFGRPIGSFQAIQHKCANMLVDLEGSRSATYYAAWAVTHDVPESHLAACMAKAFCSEACRAVAAEGIQVHGGIGFTWEHDLHLYYKRIRSSELTLGDATWHRELVARAVLDT